MSRLAPVLLACASLLACQGGSDGSSDGGVVPGSGPEVRIRGDDSLDRGPDGYRVSAIRYRFDGREDIRRLAYDDGGRIVGDSAEEADGRLRHLVVYDHDDDGRLLSKTENGNAVTYGYAAGRVRRIEGQDGDTADYRDYRHDTAGRLSGLTVSVVDPDPGAPGGEVTVYVLEYELSYRNGLLDTVIESEPGGERRRVTRRRTSSADGNFTRNVRFDHADSGLIDAVTTTLVDDDLGVTSAWTDTYEYEDEPCEGQPSARPELALLGALIGVLRPVSTALDCGYWIEQSL